MTKKLCFALIFLLPLSSGCHKKDKDLLKDIDADKFLVRTEKAQTRDITEEIVLAGSVKALEEAVLYPRVPGKLYKNLLHEGDRVKKDQPVALIERDEVGVVYEPAPVPSTINGVIGRIYRDPGENVTPSTEIALVVNQEQVRVKVDVPEQYTQQVYIGQPAFLSVEAFPNTSFQGKVYKIAPVIDPNTRTNAIEIMVDNKEGKLKSGMFAHVRLVVGRKPNALSVSRQALQKDEVSASSYYVFVPQQGNAKRVNVMPGLQTIDFAEIKSGLKPGEHVINFGLYGLKDGSKIQESASAAAGS